MDGLVRRPNRLGGVNPTHIRSTLLSIKMTFHTAHRRGARRRAAKWRRCGRGSFFVAPSLASLGREQWKRTTAIGGARTIRVVVAPLSQCTYRPTRRLTPCPPDAASFRCGCFFLMLLLPASFPSLPLELRLPDEASAAVAAAAGPTAAASPARTAAALSARELPSLADGGAHDAMDRRGSGDGIGGNRDDRTGGRGGAAKRLMIEHASDDDALTAAPSTVRWSERLSVSVAASAVYGAHAETGGATTTAPPVASARERADDPRSGRLTPIVTSGTTMMPHPLVSRSENVCARPRPARQPTAPLVMRSRAFRAPRYANAAATCDRSCDPPPRAAPRAAPGQSRLSFG